MTNSSEARNSFLSVAGKLPEAMLLTDASLCIYAANQAAEEMFETSHKGELEGHSLDTEDAEAEQRTRNYLLTCAGCGQLLPGSIQCRTLAGNTVNLRAEGTAYHHPLSKSGLVMLRLKPKVQAVAPFLELRQKIDELNREITDRVRAEEALRKSESQFRLLAGSLPAIVWSLDENGMVDYINDRYYQYTGAPEGTVGAKAWAKVVHPDDVPRSHKLYSECLERRETWQCELRLKAADGSYRWHLSCTVPIHNESGAIVRWIGFSFDIHAVKEAEQMLRSMNHELEHRVQERTQELLEMNEEMKGFTYSISHDLRSPLRGIISTARMLEEDHGDELSPDARQLSDRQVKAANRLAKLIDDLLKLSRLSRHEMRLAQVDLSATALEVLADLSPEAADLDIQPNLTAVCDPVLVRLALDNLFSNALKFTKPGDKPSLSFGGNSDGLLYVRDQGIGFDPKYENKVFQLFERLHREEEFPGTGIGLANVKRAIERHGGRIWVETQPGCGTTFYFTLQPAEPKREFGFIS